MEGSAPATEVEAGPALGAFPQTAPERAFRTDIQALRALAVSLVVANHLWPVRLPGGYVGVDVFFVISGFLITAHLSKELFASGTVRLGHFYARRTRRLLPAAFTVLAVSLACAWLWLPYTRWNANAQEIVSSAFYIENWVLAAKAVNYSEMNSSASMVQHYWSLSVEEQFYLVWPLALIGLYVLAVRRRWAQRRVLVIGLAAAAAASLCFSIYLTEASRSEAYFNTPVRVWEFGAGALLALAGSRCTLSQLVRNIMALLGFALVVFSALVFDHATPFPGWTAAVPVAGTALVILAGAGSGRLWHDRFTALRPIQFLGNISYSLYLWHWPLIVVAPFLLGTTLGTAAKVCLAVAAVLLAWLSKRWIEDRWIARSRAPSRPHRVLAAVVAGMLAMLLAGLTLHLQVAPKAAAAAELGRTDAAAPCFGPRAVGKPECGDPFARPIVDPNMGPANQYWGLPADCQEKEDTLNLEQPGGPAGCDYSGGRPEAETVWLVGDSHAQQWQSAVIELARQKHWKLKLSYSGGCPLADVPYVGYRGRPADPAKIHSCRTWGLNVAAAVERDKPARVFTSSFAAGEQIDDGTGRNQLDQYKDGFRRYWSRWAATGAVVYPIADPPLNDKVRDVNCIAVSAADPRQCRAPRDQALPVDPLVESAKAASDGGHVRLLDLSEYFCDATFCYGGVGGVAVYFDPDHLNRQYSTQLAPYLDKRL
ncbi:acyltransferase family protein [Arthrobacter sp. B3I4]|uniref:acyltransferase family protein n=1 Tax=Arthrobacter sp. B3I4 TaxID=3042267 RepID=UPI00278410B7|nr:acyltransferase family protein [Arthrobacter sp. B3I4]MDQ0755758.1 peptidoglycan/LPS O-acetylase OafA/YrhL [Arthrobacter sp. B3I4]